MAKPNRDTYPPIPLSDQFFALLARVGARQRLAVSDRAAVIEAVRALSHTYTRERGGIAQRAVGAGPELARLAFFLPRDLAKVFGPLAELLARGGERWARPLRVLDVGAGLGSTSLGVARYLALRGVGAALEVHALERDARALALFRAVADELPKLGAEFVKLTLHTHVGDAQAALPGGDFDLITCGLVLNELAEEARLILLRTLAAKLRPGGALIALEPGTHDAARALMRTRDALIGALPALSIVAPCVHRLACPMLASERDWCHEDVPFALPAQLVPVAQGAGLRYEGLSYAALVLTNEPPTQELAAPGRYRVVSDSLATKGKLELYGCSSAGYVRLSRLTRDETAQNAAFGEARRGDVLDVSGGARIERETNVAVTIGPRRATSLGAR